MKKVLCFGTFDLLHDGHVWLLTKASNLGELFVVIARDETVLKVKGISPTEDEQVRLKKVNSLGCVKKAILGSKGDKYKVLSKIKPDIIVLGYDQNIFTEKLTDELNQKNIDCEIVREKAFYPEKFKSSIIKKKLDRKETFK